MIIQFTKENLDFLIPVDFANSISRTPTMCRALNLVEKLSRDETWFLSPRLMELPDRHFYQICMTVAGADTIQQSLEALFCTMAEAYRYSLVAPAVLQMHSLAGAQRIWLSCAGCLHRVVSGLPLSKVKGVPEMIYPRNKEKRLRGQEEAPYSHRTAELKLQPRSQMNPPECVGLVGGGSWCWRGDNGSMSE